MQNILMIGWLILTVWLIFIINRKKSRIIPVCISYYLICVINDIFFVSTLELANSFGVSYQMGDMYVLILLGVWLLDCVKKPYMKRNLYNLMLVIICILLFFSMVSGVRSYGISSEWIGDLRTNATLIAPILFFGRFNVWDKAKNYRKWLDSIMSIILLISVLLWALDIFAGFHLLPSQYNATLSDGGSTMRFVPSYNVLGIALYALLLLKENLSTIGYIKIRTVLFIVAVVLFQHRSVWVAFGLGAFITVLFEMKQGKIKRIFFGQILLVLLSVIYILRFGKGDIVENIVHSIELFGKMLTDSSLEQTTVNTRHEIWKAVCEDLKGSALFFGRPYGYGYGNSIDWETSPHSGYVRFLARTGYIGGFVGLCLLFVICLKLWKRKHEHLIEILACIVTFMYAYDYTWLCGAVLGICVLKTSSNRSGRLCVNAKQSVQTSL